jgi:hypothetical protein
MSVSNDKVAYGAKFVMEVILLSYYNNLIRILQ